jgi:hypothetical protein
MEAMEVRGEEIKRRKCEARGSKSAEARGKVCKNYSVLFFYSLTFVHLRDLASF